jgi:hypothetical protein
MARKTSGRISKEDAELAKAAKEKAGGPAALAKMFGVTSPAASEWGRIRPIPRHLKRSLEEFVGLRASAAVEVQGTAVRSLAEKLPFPRLAQDVERLLDVLMSRKLANLPHRYRRRYEDRVRELLAHLGRELVEYGRLLDVEHRANLGRKRSVRHPPLS